MVKKHSDNPSRAGTLSLVGHALALDFANTSSGRGGPEYLDHFREPADVVNWAEHAGVLDAPSARRMRKCLASAHPAFASFFDDALVLREAIHRAAGAITMRTAPPEADLATIKAFCVRAIAAAELAPGPNFRWTWPTNPPVPEAVLGPVALSAVGLLREGDLTRLKQCPGEHCGWLFFDLSKNNSRRWCDMAVCGNRTKARRHRQRHSFTATEAG